ncbi:hypothetical protein TNCV_3159261 [Trichonephila clavipes]|nr:hypothetical protein TNCV_3159261 [Trichonephila clavipes]
MERLLTTDFLILNLGQVTRTVPELATHARVRCLICDRLNVHQPAREDESSVLGVNINVTLCSATQGTLVTDLVILNHGQVTWATPELAPPSPNCITPLHRGSLVVLGSNS